MQFIKIGQHYVNMAQVHQVTDDEKLHSLFLYTSDHTIRVDDPAERGAVLAWLGRNSINVLARRER